MGYSPASVRSNGDSDKIDRAKFDALLLDYEMARHDDRQSQTVLSAMIGVAIALLGALVAAVRQGVLPDGQRGPTALPVEVLTLSPLLPLGAISYILIIGSGMTVRSFYMRALEDEIRSIFSCDLKLLPGVKPFSGVEFAVSYVSGRRGRKALRVANLVLLIAILIVFGGVVTYIGTVLPPKYQLAMAIAYGPVALLLFSEGIFALIIGRNIFRQTLRRFRDGGYRSIQNVGQESDIDERSIWRYLLAPRPADLIKWIFVPVTVLVGLLLPGSRSLTWTLVGTTLFSWLMLEYLLYYSRYQINDIRGVKSDQEHHGKRSRKRLPTRRYGVRRSITISLLVTVARLALFASLAAVDILNLSGTLLVVGIALLTSTLSYEFARSDFLARRSSPKKCAALIWATVGSGYAIRVCLGLYLTGVTSPQKLILFGAAAWFFGIMFVTMTWLVDAAGNLYLLKPCRYVADGDWLEREPHLGQLLPFVGVYPHSATRHDLEKIHEKGLKKCSDLSAYALGSKIIAPWHLGLVASVTLGSIACTSGVPTSNSFGSAALLALIATAGAAVLCLRQSSSRRAKCFVIVTLGIIAVQAVTSTTFGWGVLAMWLIFAGTFIGFQDLSYQDIEEFNSKIGNMIARAVGSIWDFFVKLLVGRATWMLINQERENDRKQIPSA